MKANFITLMKKIIFTFLLIFLVTLHVNAQTTITSWTYDPLNGTATSPNPNIGSGTSTIVNLATIPNNTTTGLASTSGCGAGNSGLAWQHDDFDPGSSNEVNGVQFNAGTTGYNNIIFTWDQRFSNASPNTVRLQYTTDGSTWNNFTMTNPGNTTFCAGSINTNGCYETNTGSLYRRIRVDFSSISGANNNANFGIRLLASYYQSSGQYRQSKTPALVATALGAWRFDNVSFLGTPTSTGAVISGSTSICSGGSANINVTITGGSSPYQVVYNDGTSNTTLSNYISGSIISVSPGSTTTYNLVSVTSSNGSTVTPLTGSAVVTVTAGSSPTFTSSASTNSCASTDIVYTTQSGMDNYSWTFLKGAAAAGLNTDYIITAGSTSSETVTIQWVLTSGTATFSASVTYDSCSGASVTSSTTVYVLPSTPTWSAQPSGNVCTNVNTTYTTANNRFEASKIWNNSQGKSGFEVVSLYDTNNSLQHVVYLWVSNMLLGIFSKSTTAFTPLIAIPGFTDTIKPGFTAGTLSGMKFNVRASSSDTLVDSLGVLKNADAFMSRTDDNSSVGTLTIQNALPLILGANQNFEIAANSTALTITSNNSGQDYKIRVKNSGGTKDAITVKSLTQRVGIFNESPSYTLDVTGSFRASTQFKLPQYSDAERDARTLTSANNGELIYNTTTDTVQAYAAGVWVDLH